MVIVDHHSHELFEYSNIIEAHWKNANRPTTAKALQDAIPVQWYNLPLKSAIGHKKEPESAAALKLRGSEYVNIDERLLNAFEDDHNAVFKGFIDLCYEMYHNRVLRTLDMRTSDVGSPSALIGGSALVFGDPPTYSTTKARTEIIPKAKLIPRLACVAIIETSVRDRYRQNLIHYQPGLRRFRENLAATLTGFVRKSRINLKGDAETHDIEHYFFADGIDALTVPEYDWKHFNKEEDVDQYSDDDEDRVNDLEGPEDGLGLPRLRQLRKSLKKEMLSNPILRTGMIDDGIYPRAYVACELFLSVSVFFFRLKRLQSVEIMQTIKELEYIQEKRLQQDQDHTNNRIDLSNVNHEDSDEEDEDSAIEVAEMPDDVVERSGLVALVSHSTYSRYII